ncbi:MAG: adenosylmethionine--8-amino-7-oxononanoate transaminase [Lentisphaerae bacterium GWF2_52_8]|nr:MAG: adenosylmethionine--8-amino-7-oxononanoate transaminase [Lentisphaerae bacterium GWF2_52_8]
MKQSEIIALDAKHVWHPCAQMKDYEDFPPLPVASASGSHIITKDGRRIIDAISSWWCKALGHGHPRIRCAVEKQMDKFEHVLLANTCNETVAELSARLAGLCPPLTRVFYADNGSTAMEIAMKMSLQYHLQTGMPERRHFASLSNGYHGESILTLAAGDCELYSSPFAAVLPRIQKLAPIRYCSGPQDPAWQGFPEEAWNKIKNSLDAKAEQLSAIIFEPVLQGAGGMLIYSPDLLRRLRDWADKNHVQLIADEIMTGFARTGPMLACEHAGIKPDFIALSKGLTAGWGPMSAVLCSEDTYMAFYGDYFSGKAFMHSNTYCGHALGAAAALETLKIFEEEDIPGQVKHRSQFLADCMKSVADSTKSLRNLRSIGFMAAADIVNPSTGQPYPKELRIGFKASQAALRRGALLRPLGDTIYFLPPLNTDNNTLTQLAEITEAALCESTKNA